MDIDRDERRVRGFLREVRTFSKAEGRGEEKRTEGKQIRENAKEKSQPEVPPVFSPEGDTAPEPMRNDVHTGITSRPSQPENTRLVLVTDPAAIVRTLAS